MEVIENGVMKSDEKMESCSTRDVWRSSHYLAYSITTTTETFLPPQRFEDGKRGRSELRSHGNNRGNSKCLPSTTLARVGSSLNATDSFPQFYELTEGATQISSLDASLHCNAVPMFVSRMGDDSSDHDPQQTTITFRGDAIQCSPTIFFPSDNKNMVEVRKKRSRRDCHTNSNNNINIINNTANNTHSFVKIPQNDPKNFSYLKKKDEKLVHYNMKRQRTNSLLFNYDNVNSTPFCETKFLETSTCCDSAFYTSGFLQLNGFDNNAYQNTNDHYNLWSLYHVVPVAQMNAISIPKEPISSSQMNAEIHSISPASLFPNHLLGRNGRICRRNGFFRGCVTTSLTEVNLKDPSSPIFISSCPCLMSTLDSDNSTRLVIPRSQCFLLRKTAESHIATRSKTQAAEKGLLDRPLSCFLPSVEDLQYDLKRIENRNRNKVNTNKNNCSNLMADSKTLKIIYYTTKPAYLLLWRYETRKSLCASLPAYVSIEAQFVPIKSFGLAFQKVYGNATPHKTHVLDQLRAVRTKSNAKLLAWCLVGCLEYTLKEIGLECFTVHEIKRPSLWAGFPEMTLDLKNLPRHQCLINIIDKDVYEQVKFFTAR